MRWKIKDPPRDDAERLVRLFAFLPTWTDDGYGVWLSHYWSREFYSARLGKWLACDSHAFPFKGAATTESSGV